MYYNYIVFTVKKLSDCNITQYYSYGGVKACMY
jgi:hypothetical protein